MLESVVSSLDRSVESDRNNYGIIDDTSYSKLSTGNQKSANKGTSKSGNGDTLDSPHKYNKPSSNPINQSGHPNQLTESGRSVRKIKVHHDVDELTFEAPLSGPENPSHGLDDEI